MAENTHSEPLLEVLPPQEDRERRVAKRPKTGGRKKGSVNKITRLKLEAANQQLVEAHSGKKLSIDYMDEMIEWFRHLVGATQPFEGNGLLRPGYNEKTWFKMVELFQGFLAMRAPYQSPRLSAVQIVPAGQAQQRTTVNVTILNERGDKVFSDDDGEDAKLIEHDSGEGEEAA